VLMGRKRGKVGQSSLQAYLKLNELIYP
jgi:hypothetical protein